MSSFDFSIKITFAGQLGVGKESLCIRYTSNTYTDYRVPSCIGINFEYKYITISRNLKVRQIIYNTMKQERFRTFSPEYYRGSQVVLLCFDLSDLSTIDRLYQYIKDINQITNCSFLLVGTKLDKVSPSIVKEYDILKFLSLHPMPLIITSSKLDIGFDQLEEEIKKIAELVVLEQNNLIDLNPKLTELEFKFDFIQLWKRFVNS